MAGREGDKTERQRMKTRTRKLRIGNSAEIRLFSVYLVSEVHSQETLGDFPHSHLGVTYTGQYSAVVGTKVRD